MTKPDLTVNVKNGHKGFVSVPLRDRVERKINRNDGCWTYGAYGKTKSEARARIHVNGKNEIAARVIWKLYRGKIPEGMLVCHQCDNGFCVNPGHLFLGTQTDNMRDSAIKGRRPSKLTPAEVKMLRKEYVENKISQHKLAKKYGISRQQVCNIISGRSWAHV